MRDSAGVEIIEYERGALASVPVWTLAPPSLSLGPGRDGAAYEFTSVLAAARLRGDTVVVIDRGVGELRYFDSTGAFLRSAGHLGRGPREFAGLLSASFVAPDTVAVWDYGNQRVSLFDAAGRLVGEVSIAPAAQTRGLTILTRLGDGGWAARTRDVWYLQVAELPESTIRDSVSYVRIDPDGSDSRTVLTLPNYVLDVRPRALGGTRRRYPFPRSFSPEAHVEGAAGRVVAGVSDRFDLLVHAADGRRRIVRVDVDVRDVTDEDLEARLAALRARMAGRPRAERERELRAVRETPAMDVFPAFDRVRVGRDGSLWVRAFVGPRDRSATWTVFDGESRLRGTVPTGPDLEILEASLDEVVVLRRDALDVERVEVREVVHSRSR